MRFLSWVTSYLVLLGLSGSICAQDYEALYYSGGPVIEELPFQLLTEVKSATDFAGRYNGYHNAMGYPLDTTSDKFIAIRSRKIWWTQYRYKIIGSLLAERCWARDSLTAISFVHQAAKGPRLDLNTTDWSAEIPISLTHKGRKLKGNLILRPYFNDREGSRWLIHDIIWKSALIQKDPQSELCPEIDRDVFITPSAHDNGFVELKSLINEKGAVKYHVIEVTDGLELLSDLVDKGWEVSFHGPLVFIFNIDETIRFKTNDAWRIIEIY